MNDSTFIAALFTLGCILAGYALIAAAQAVVDLHRAGMARLRRDREKGTA